MTVTRAYGPDAAQVYDLHLPSPSTDAAELAPSAADDALLPQGGTVLVVHGGFWRKEWDREHTAAQVAGLAAAGWHVAVAEYRRAGMPGGGVPGTFDDITALVKAVAADPELPGPLVLMGHSAGGQLVAWAANQPSASRLAGVAGVVVLAGCVDLMLLDELHLGADAAHDFLGDPQLHPDAWAFADPAQLLPPLVPVRLVAAAEDDEVPVEVSRAYLDKAVAAGGDVTLDVVDGVDHYELIEPSSAAWPHVLAALSTLVATV